jgi:hypothetical protein
MLLLLSLLPSFLRLSLTNLAFSAIKKRKLCINKRFRQRVQKHSILFARSNHTVHEIVLFQILIYA